ncbi:MAG: DNA polymerase III subunit beta [Candidatus Zixiibacteriota bacterium]|nr:MAG: DNA polymerase III subunit beta [candidate division Zixibacteria bacterium]
MKFTLPKSRLGAHLQSILQVVPSKSTLPILTNILIEALESKLKISATDLDISITVSMDCKVTKKGSVVLPARMLSDIIRELPESEITVETSAQRVELKVPNGSYKIAAVPPEDFPKLPSVNTKKEISINSPDFIAMVQKTTFACSSDETRPALNGVLWQTNGDRMQMVATDGHRLAKMSTENKKLKGMFEDVIIPPKVLDLIPKLIKEENKEIGIIFGENNIIFNLGDTILSSRLLEGPYPNFEQVIPTDNDKKMVISRNELASSVRRVSILSNILTHQVKFSIGKNSLTLSTTNPDVGGEGIETLECEYDGETIELGYNANYIVEVLNKIDSDEVVFELSSSVSAGLVYNTDISKDDYLCLVMPLRLAE